MGRTRSKRLDQKSDRRRLSLTLGSKYSIMEGYLLIFFGKLRNCKFTKKIARSACSTQVWSSSKSITELDQEVAAAFKTSHRIGL